MGLVTDGYGHEIKDPNWIGEHLFEYLPLDQAAKLIDPNWSRHHIHKEIAMGRVFPSHILILYDSEIINPNFGGGKRMFITRTEIQRIKEDYESRPKRKLTYCEHCQRQLRYCNAKPCSERVRDTPEFRESVEELAEYFTKFSLANQAKGRSIDGFLERKKAAKQRQRGRHFERDNETPESEV